MDFLSGSASFNEAFPELIDITVEYSQEGDGTAYIEFPHTYGKNTPSNFECHNPSCRGGGRSLQRAIRNMIDQKQETKVINVRCNGRVGSEQCSNRFLINLTLKYRQ